MMLTITDVFCCDPNPITVTRVQIGGGGGGGCITSCIIPIRVCIIIIIIIMSHIINYCMTHVNVQF